MRHGQDSPLLDRWRRQRPEVLLLGLLVVAAFGLILGVILTSGSRLAYDEPYHLSNCVLLQQKRFFSEAFFRGTPYSAAGPLYPVIYTLTSPLTHFSGWRIRLVNLTLFLAALALWGFSLRQNSVSHPWLRSCMVLTIPPFWMIVGIALTEIPTMLMLSAAVYSIIRAFQENSDSPSKPLLALGALFLATASLGRSIYVVPCLLLFLSVALTRKVGLVALLILLSSLIPSLVLFYSWRGLMPPGQAHISHGVSISHAVLGICYTSFIAALLSLDYSAYRNRSAAVGAAVVFCANLVVGWMSRSPGLGLGLYERTDVLGILYGRFFGSILLAFAAYFTVLAAQSLRQAWGEKDAVRLWLLSATAALALSPLLITHLWSIRYALAAVPFLIPLLGNRIQLSWFRVLAFAVGMAAGCQMLTHFLHVHYAPAEAAFPSQNDGQ